MVREPLRAAGVHAVVVFGCPARPDGSPTPALERRLRRAAEIARADEGARIIVSGGAVIGPCEAVSMRAWLVAAGLAEARVVLEPAARDTLDNARLSAALVAQLGATRVTLVTERYHVRRSALLLRGALTARALAVELEVAAAPDLLAGAPRVVEALRERIKLAFDLTRSRLLPPRRRGG